MVDSTENAIKMENKYAKNRFAILADHENFVAKSLGQQWKWSKLGRMPGMLLVDRKGTIQYAYYSSNMKDIPENDNVLAIIDQYA